MNEKDLWSARVRRGFWRFYLVSYPQAWDAGIKASNGWDCRVPMTSSGNVVLSINLGTSYCTAFLRPPDGSPHEPVRKLLKPLAEQLVVLIGAPFEPNPDQGFLKTRVELGIYEPDNWPAIAEWFETARHIYRRAVDISGTHA